MLNEGLTLMTAGMGTVFAFLAVLWAAVTIMGKIVTKLNELFPEEAEEAKAAVKSVSADVEVAIAVAAAKLRK